MLQEFYADIVRNFSYRYRYTDTSREEGNNALLALNGDPDIKLNDPLKCYQGNFTKKVVIF